MWAIEADLPDHEAFRVNAEGFSTVGAHRMGCAVVSKAAALDAVKGLKDPRRRLVSRDLETLFADAALRLRHRRGARAGAPPAFSRAPLRRLR